MLVNFGDWAFLSLLCLDELIYAGRMEDSNVAHTVPFPYRVASYRHERLRCKTGGKDYPSGVPHNVTKVLELDIVSTTFMN